MALSVFVWAMIGIALASLSSPRATCARANAAASLAMTIRAAIRTAAHRLSSDPELDPRHYAHELAELFDRATASTSAPTPTEAP